VAEERIATLAAEVEAARVASYAEEFKEDTVDDQLLIGAISLEEVQAEERRIREDHVAFQKQEADFYASRQERLAQLEDRAKRAVLDEFNRRRKEMAQLEKLQLLRERLQRDSLNKAFVQAEGRLLDAIARRKGEVSSFYGDLVLTDGQYAGNKDRRWRIDWDRAPQPLQIKLDSIRGLKDRVPRGRYVLLATLYDRLGGHIMRWSRMQGQEWNGATLPTAHEGTYKDVELKFDQSLFCVVPSRIEVLPGMVIAFELYRLKQDHEQNDQVLGWGAFPFCDTEFNIIDGRFKVPMLKGVMDWRITEHDAYERRIKEDIDAWIGNLYFELVRCPRYVGDQKEFEVELQHTSGLLGYPSRPEDNEQSFGSQDEAKPPLSKAGPSSSSMVVGGRDGGITTSKSSLTRQISTQSVQSNRSYGGGGTMNQVGSRRASLTTGAPSMDPNTDVPLDRDEPVAPGLSYIMRADRADTYHRRTFAMLPETAQKQLAVQTREQKLADHTMSVVPKIRNEILHPEKQRMLFARRQLVAELGIRQTRTQEFWIFILALTVCFWLRMWTHYLAQWGYLQYRMFPVSTFQLQALSVDLVYQDNLLYTYEVFTLVTVGTLLNYVVVLLLCGIVFTWQRTMGHASDHVARFIAAWAILALLDPILILICDCIYGRYKPQPNESIGDAFKLYYHFADAGESGLPGVFLTIFLFFVLIFLGIVIFYYYYLRLHLNGRLLDVYRRIAAESMELFVPFDHEISNRELYGLVKKAEKWRGPHGERRKVAIYDFVYEEDAESAVKGATGKSLRRRRQRRSKQRAENAEVTTHISIHTLHLDGLREVYRQFLRLPEGAIIEVFGEITGAGFERLDRKVQENFKRRHLNLNSMAREATAFLSHALDSDGTESEGGERSRRSSLTNVAE